MIKNIFGNHQIYLYARWLTVKDRINFYQDAWKRMYKHTTLNPHCYTILMHIHQKAVGTIYYILFSDFRWNINQLASIASTYRLFLYTTITTIPVRMIKAPHAIPKTVALATEKLNKS